MATLVLQTAGSAIGGAIGGPFGAMAGRALGGLAGAAIDGAILNGGGNSSPRIVEGPRLTDMNGLGSTEGAAIPRVFGRARIGGEAIWATRFEEVANVTVTRSPSSGGKGLGGGGQKTVETTYSYFANLAVGLCEGPVAFVRRVWADGRELDQNSIVMRLHRGYENQPADPLIVAKEGAEHAPAYRGLAYVVFERLPLAAYGNRVPQFTFEVVRPVGGLCEQIRAVCLIPGASEFGYAMTPVVRLLDPGVTRPENRHDLSRGADITASLDVLQALCPNLARVAVVASWFGDDLRAGTCTIRPKVEDKIRLTEGMAWRAGGLTRAEALPVSRVNDAPAYGGTPSDAAILELIANLKARGLEVLLYPFVMMDVAAGNALPDPWTGDASQPPYPWRGRITCMPAPGRPGSPDASGVAAAQVDAFFGTAQASDFAADIDSVAYGGPDEWSFRRHILHYAHLAGMAGGVDAFLIGSEMVSLTRIRGAGGSYPAAAHLCALAADVRAVLGPATKLAYAADWTEYGAHVLAGGADVGFPLDPLWAHPAIDAIGIDFYPPISDWRDGLDHADRDHARSLYDVDHLRDRIGSGEAFDWFYASPSDRLAQVRTPIADGAFGKPWVFRTKDLLSWWENEHRPRVAGIEQPPTGWVPRSKPLWLTEIGIPAVDKGPNGPNVFPDPKSSENARPPFSRATRDDLAQARGLAAILSRFDPALPGFADAFNPASSVYGGRMVDPAHVYVWAWDARPFPAFPDQQAVWSDGPNWETGHWLNGRLESVELDRLIRALCAGFGLTGIDVSAVDGMVDGYVIDRPMSARAALEPLLRAFGAQALARAGTMVFSGRSASVQATLGADELVPEREGEPFRLVRAQESELPRELRLAFTDGDGDYRRAAVASRRLSGQARRELGEELAAILRPAEARRLAEARLAEIWAGRETLSFALSPRRIELEPGDVIALETPDPGRRWRIDRIADGEVRRIEAVAVEPSLAELPAPAGARPVRAAPPVPGKPSVIALDLPLARGDPPGLLWLAAYADPWPEALTVWRSTDGSSFAAVASVPLRALIGVTTTTLASGPLWRWDEGEGVEVRLAGGALASLSDAAVLEGANALAFEGPDGAWEIIAAARAELVGPGRYRLSRLLRGLGNSEGQAARTLAAGARVVLLDEALVPLATSPSDLGRPFSWRVGPAGRDHADPAMVEFTAAAGPGALAPLPPVHVRARRVPEGVAFAFVRRSRVDADGWEPAEIPLGEAFERYTLDVMDGSTVRRTLTVDAPGTLYAAADEFADFGTPQAALTLAIAQVSAIVGRGPARIATVAIS